MAVRHSAVRLYTELASDALADDVTKLLPAPLVAQCQAQQSAAFAQAVQLPAESTAHIRHLREVLEQHDLLPDMTLSIRANKGTECKDVLEWLAFTDP